MGEPLSWWCRAWPGAPARLLYWWTFMIPPLGKSISPDRAWNPFGSFWSERNLFCSSSVCFKAIVQTAPLKADILTMTIKEYRPQVKWESEAVQHNPPGVVSQLIKGCSAVAIVSTCNLALSLFFQYRQSCQFPITFMAREILRGGRFTWWNYFGLWVWFHGSYLNSVSRKSNAQLGQHSIVNRVWDLSQELSLILESIFYQLQVLGQLINSRKIRVIVLGLLRVVKIRIGVKGLVVGLMVYILISAQGWG